LTPTPDCGDAAELVDNVTQ
jgi:hypothetical protein